MFIFPIGTGKRIKVRPYVTIGLIAANVLIFLITDGIVKNQINDLVGIRQRMSEIEKEYLGDMVINSFMVMTAEEIDARDQLILQGAIIPRESVDYEIWTGLYTQLRNRINHFIYRKLGFIPAAFNFFAIFSAMFLHGGWGHLIGNMLFLWLAGANLEGEFGWKRFLLLYFLWGAAAMLFHYSLQTSSETPCIGASGAIAGLMGAFLICFYKTRIEFLFGMPLIFTKKFRVAAYICLPLWFLFQLFSSRYAGAGAGVAFSAHIGGFTVGAITIIILQAAELLPKIDPKSDIAEDLKQTSEELVASLEDKTAFIQNAGIEDLPTLLAIVRVEPDNNEALLALARLQYRPVTMNDSLVSYNRALDAALSGSDASGVSLIYREMAGRNILKSLTRENMLRLMRHLEKLLQYNDAVRLAIMFVFKFPQDLDRPRIIYKAYLLYKNHLHDQERAAKAALMLRKEYPHLLKASS